MIFIYVIAFNSVCQLSTLFNTVVTLIDISIILKEWGIEWALKHDPKMIAINFN